MLSILRSRRGGPASPRGPRGCRVYAIGDVHGRLDLLRNLLRQIEEDTADRPDARTLIVFLGDLIDRGPDSAGVLEFLRRYRPPTIEPVFLMGNHEEVMLRVLGGERGGLLDRWLSYGGSETLTSYGVSASTLFDLPERRALEQVVEAVAPAHTAFLESFSDTFRFGDYLMVHAGVRPGLPLHSQTQEDLHWIREPFLSDPRNHGFVVVHGHTIVDQVEQRPNRIGIDTGAYRSGLLSAIGIQDAERWLLQEQGQPAIDAAARDVETAAP
jgi:serine/threonine protein phosphatase 1